MHLYVFFLHPIIFKISKLVMIFLLFEKCYLHFLNYGFVNCIMDFEIWKHTMGM